jgi:hypothetical protein
MLEDEINYFILFFKKNSFKKAKFNKKIKATHVIFKKTKKY